MTDEKPRNLRGVNLTETRSMRHISGGLEVKFGKTRDFQLVDVSLLNNTETQRTNQAYCILKYHRFGKDNLCQSPALHTSIKVYYLKCKGVCHNEMQMIPC